MTSVLIPTPPATLQLELLAAAHESGQVTQRLRRRHTPIQANARVLSILGLTGENLIIGFALGRLDADAPDILVVGGDVRDPALAARLGAALADALEPLLAAELSTGSPMQLLVDSAGTVNQLNAWSHRLRSPWLPGPYQHDRDLIRDAGRCQHLHALLRAVISANRHVGADIIIDAVTSLTDHYTFPLGGSQEQQQLAVLLTCLRYSGADIHLPELAPAGTDLTVAIEHAETISYSATADPDWDNQMLVPALSAYKRLRNRAAAGDQMKRIDTAVVRRAAELSGLDATVRLQLLARHRATAAAFRTLKTVPELNNLGRRRADVEYEVTTTLQRGVDAAAAWADFPSLGPAARAADNDAKRTSAGILEAVRGDQRCWAFTEANMQAATATVTSVSPNGRVWQLQLAHPLTPRSTTGWWWLDDNAATVARGTLDMDADDDTLATLTLSQGMQAIAANPALVTTHAIRLTCLPQPFEGRRWWPTPADASVATAAPWSTPLDLASLEIVDAS
jgi:hypothetical protein